MSILGSTVFAFGLEARLELVDQRHVRATDEADLAALGLHRGGRTDEEGALLLGEGQLGDVVGLGRVGGVVDDGEADVLVGLGRGTDRVGVDEADTDDVGAPGVDELVEAVLAGRVVLALAGLDLVDLDAELVLGLVQALGGGVVERLVAATTHVVGEAGLDVAAAALAGGGVTTGVTPPHALRASAATDMIDAAFTV